MSVECHGSLLTWNGLWEKLQRNQGPVYLWFFFDEKGDLESFKHNKKNNKGLISLSKVLSFMVNGKKIYDI